MRFAVLVLTAAAAAACGEDTNIADASVKADAAPVDAAAALDAAADATVDASFDATVDASFDAIPSPVVEVPCPEGTDATVTVVDTKGGYRYVVDTHDRSLTVGAIVDFQMTDIHDAASGNPKARTDTFYAGFDRRTCFQFTEAGEYPFFCTLHLFSATISIFEPQ